ncbi:sulfatase-like hydrolase/transferase [Acinetobacter higginsii]|uniref:sulfatase-like hydrolase/transferase n=1 Tax=Acinetobacter higginsii TaxID=70347 RepID=UPI00267766C5|nr:sulfatase-like hydrolase/transferase [Acinetobacter higginsii]MDO3664251.1 sulfatase-like hydrolase/transferase [Acinetobacter higginsii]
MNFLYILLLFLAPNIFWQTISYFFEIHRSFINFDYILILVFFQLNKKKLGIIVFSILCFFDFLNLFSQIFPFIRILDLFYLIKFSLFASPVNLSLPLVFFVFIFLYFYILKKNISNLKGLGVIIFINILLFSFFIQNYFLQENNRVWSIEAKKIINSQLLNTYEVRSDGFLDDFSTQGDAFQHVSIPSASENLKVQPFKHNKILLIVNESWGVVPDQIQQSILEDVIESPQIASHEIGSLTTNGFTINGEIRELCGIGLKHFNLKDQNNGFDSCLANLYKKQGYSTIAMHGATGAMYDRKYWYPKAGFDHVIFRDTLETLKSRCYSFPGFCDRDLLPLITEQFRAKEKIFYYWLTLNSHVNYDLRDLKKDLFDCRKFGIDISSTSCRNLKLQKQFFYYLAELIKKPEMHGAYIIVVGDHAPPVYGNSKNIFEKDTVGVLMVQVK